MTAADAPSDAVPVAPAYERVGVVGAGLMGAEIALVQALSGCTVLLLDQTVERLQSAVTRLGGLLEKGVARGAYSVDQSQEALARIATTTDISRLVDRQYITEAVFEDQATKVTVLGQLNRFCAPNCLIATNTSTIPISTLACALSATRRARFIGTHYFSPVSRMKLVEVIPGFETSRETIEAATAHCRRIGKEPIAVKDVAGFAVNRMLHALIIEAVRLVEEGVATPESLDAACRLGLGHAMGPFELMDAVTSSLCVQAQEIMQEAYGERFRPPPLLKQRVRAGFVGGKGAIGWRNTPTP
jgi:3-hydroxybutyryl-CoA dehydrogenase